MTVSGKNTFWVALFAVSVMANMFFLGMWCARGMHHRGMMPPGSPPSPIAQMHEAARGLPQADRDIVDSVFQKYNGLSHTHMKAMHQAFSHLHDVLTGPEYSPAALKQAHQAIAKADEAMKRDIEGAMSEVAAKLSPDSRAAFFKEMLPPPPHGFPGGPNKDFDDRPTDRGTPPVE